MAAATPMAGAPRMTIVSMASADLVLDGPALDIDFLQRQLPLVDHDDLVVRPFDRRAVDR